MLHACMEWTLKTRCTTRAQSAAQPNVTFTAFALMAFEKHYLPDATGSHNANFTTTLAFINSYSAEGIPTVVTLRNRDGALCDAQNQRTCRTSIGKIHLHRKEFFTLETPSGGPLNAWMIKPVDFDERQDLPLFMFVYGGPGSQTVMNSYDAFRGMWFQMLANELI